MDDYLVLVDDTHIKKPLELIDLEREITKESEIINGIAQNLLTTCTFTCEGKELVTSLESHKKQLALLSTQRLHQINNISDTYFHDLFSEASTAEKPVAKTDDFNDSNVCPHTYIILDEKRGERICETCGMVVDSTFYSYNFGETPQIISVGIYKPASHFLDTIRDYQNTKHVTLPKSVNAAIMREIHRLRYKSYEVTAPVVKSILKTLEKTQKRIKQTRDCASLFLFINGITVTRPKTKRMSYTHYYKNGSQIAGNISKAVAPCMTPMQEERLMHAYIRAIRAYRTSPRYVYRQNNRHKRKKLCPNNMNCNYIFYKLCQLLGYTVFLPYIPLPKSNSNIDDNDQNGWKHICMKNRWNYIKSR